LLADAVADVVGEFGGDGSGLHGADADVLGGEFLAKGFAEGGDSELCGAVHGGSADGLASGDGADVD
jgi:hypothetical protein